jgi:hypothetical protein
MEKYREATEAWLEANSIRYKDLIMAPDTQTHTMEAHAKHKAAFLAEHPECLLFVESSPKQAARIAELSGRPVICTTTEAHWNTDAPARPQCTFAKRHDRIIYTISTGPYEQCTAATQTPPPGWDFRRVTSADCPPYLSPKQQAAWAKINGPRIFSEYAESLCIDDDMEVTGDPAPLFDGAEMTTLTRERNATWQTDLALVEGERMAAPSAAVQAEIARLARAGFDDSANYMTGIIHRRHTDAVQALCDEWWYWYGQSETRRDQPSLAVACQRRSYAPAVITEGQAAICIRHDSRKAAREGTRAIAPVVLPKNWEIHKPKRKGDRL